jgi:hypothetical protein
MTQPLVIPDRDQFRLPDVRRPGPMPSLPAWVASRVSSLTTELQRNPLTGNREQMPTLPAGLVLSPMQKADVQQHARDLRALCMPHDDAETEQRLVDMLTEFVCVKPLQGQNELSAAALGATVLVALNDLPLWSVERAIIRFHRGDWALNGQGERYDYRWCPPSADLRRIAYGEMIIVRYRAEQLEQLVQAVPREEFSEEHCARMCERLLDLRRQLSSPLVGTDGSAAERRSVDGAHCGTRPKAQPGLKREGGRRRHGVRRK